MYIRLVKQIECSSGGDNVDDGEEDYDPESAFQDVGTSKTKKQRVDIVDSAAGTSSANNDPQFSDDEESPRNAPIRSKNQVERVRLA